MIDPQPLSPTIPADSPKAALPGAESPQVDAVKANAPDGTAEISRRQFGLGLAGAAALAASASVVPAAWGAEGPAFGKDFPELDSLSTGEWWTKKAKGNNAPPPLDVPREQVVAFALYTCERGVLKLSAQLFPLKPGEPRTVRLEFQRDGVWTEAAQAEILYPGWSAHFRLEKWDMSRTVPYRVRHGERASFEGKIRRDPIDKDRIVIANMSCNSSRTTGERPEIVKSLLAHDPDVLFFAGDQTYRHTEHTAGWIEFGLQFRDVIRDRPTITIPDDHDVGHPNLWGENGKKALRKDGSDGGYFYPAEYVNLVQRHQTWHLPDPVDPALVEQGIGVYFTRMRVGGVDFAILEDRKFKSGPEGKIPKMGPRPDHINDPAYDPKSIDLPGLELLGERQQRFLKSWGADWEGVEIKAVLSATAFCGAVHMHGTRENRLLADLDCNGWPQTGRRKALEELRRVRAVHLCGDQHLAVVVQHGLDAQGDGPYSFTSPALVNTIYGRWWHPLDERPGPNPVAGSPLPWTGDFRDGLGNLIRMLAYANPPKIQDEKQRADGYGLVTFDKKTRRVTFSCYPRFPSAGGEEGQFPGWPITVDVDANDGRPRRARLPEITVTGVDRPVIEVSDDTTGEVLYVVRMPQARFRAETFAPGKYTLKIGRDRPDGKTLAGLVADAEGSGAPLTVAL